MAKKEYREAYDAGDSEKLVEAQDKLTSAKLKIDKAASYAENINQRRALQDQENEVQIPQAQQNTPKIDAKTQSWLDENPWYGSKKAMSNFAVGIHEELIDEYGPNTQARKISINR